MPAGDDDSGAIQVRTRRFGPRIALLLSLGMTTSAGLSADHTGPGALPDSLASTVGSIQQGLEQTRGHRYLRAIHARTMHESEVRDFLLRKLAKEYPDPKLLAEQTAWIHFGFLDDSDNLKDLFVGMLTQQAAGFYDPDDRSLILVSGKALPGLALVHELAHALADQMFDLGRLLDSARHNDDLLMAVSAMVEGEAQALSTTYVESTEGARILDHAAIRTGGIDASPPANRMRIPAMMMHMFTFPYTQGMIWAKHVVSTGGQSAMDGFYREPPDSTEQIMHPEKSATPRDRPSLIHPDLLGVVDVPLRDAGYVTVKENVMGEFGIRELFGGASVGTAETAAAGWDADLFRVSRGSAGGTALIWITVWDSTADAAEFLNRATGWLAGRHPGTDKYSIGSSGPDGRFVHVIEGFESDLTERIETALSPAIAGKVTLR